MPQRVTVWSVRIWPENQSGIALKEQLEFKRAHGQVNAQDCSAFEKKACAEQRHTMLIAVKTTTTPIHDMPLAHLDPKFVFTHDVDLSRASAASLQLRGRLDDNKMRLPKIQPQP
jgi:hypothetical protein